MKKAVKIIAWMLFILVSGILLIYTYALLAPLSLSEQRQHITLYDRSGDILYESNFGEDMTWCDLEDIPIQVQDAFVAVEDRRFYLHMGFDPIRIASALRNNLRSDTLQGGSTITQQYAKNLFLTNEQTLQRKIEEFFYAVRLEMHYSKADILEGYLNTLYFGHGVYGISEASSYYFGKTMDELNAGELAMLVGVANGPGAFSPYLHYDNAISRQQTVLQVLKDEQVISEKEYESAMNEELVLLDHADDESEDDIRAYYIDAVLNELSSIGLSGEQLDVYTYFDARASRALYLSLQENLDSDSEIQAAAVILEPFTDHILAMAGGKSYTESQYNRALHAERQIASTIKPLLYYCALQQGFTPSTTFISQPTTFQLGDNDTYAPGNYGDQYPYQEISMINAIGMSDNIYAVKTHLFLGTQTLQDALKQYGITADDNASLALGTVSLNVCELASIYNSFASEGLYAKPQLIAGIRSGENWIMQDETQMKQLLKRDETLILSQLLTATYDPKNTTYAYPSMLGSAPEVTTAVKSGTSDWDSLTAGYNPQYTVVIWNGYDDNRTLERADMTHARKIFQSVFNKLYKDQEGPWYERPDTLEERVVDPISGELSANGSPYWYKKK